MAICVGQCWRLYGKKFFVLALYQTCVLLDQVDGPIRFSVTYDELLTFGIIIRVNTFV